MIPKPKREQTPTDSAPPAQRRQKGPEVLLESRTVKLSAQDSKILLTDDKSTPNEALLRAAHRYKDLID